MPGRHGCRVHSLAEKQSSAIAATGITHPFRGAGSYGSGLLSAAPSPLRLSDRQTTSEAPHDAVLRLTCAEAVAEWSVAVRCRELLRRHHRVAARAPRPPETTAVAATAAKTEPEDDSQGDVLPAALTKVITGGGRLGAVSHSCGERVEASLLDLMRQEGKLRRTFECATREAADAAFTHLQARFSGRNREHGPRCVCCCGLHAGDPVRFGSATQPNSAAISCKGEHRRCSEYPLQHPVICRSPWHRS